jgi:hypothetical protein
VRRRKEGSVNRAGGLGWVDSCRLEKMLLHPDSFIAFWLLHLAERAGGRQQSAELWAIQDRRKGFYANGKVLSKRNQETFNDVQKCGCGIYAALYTDVIN